VLAERRGDIHQLPREIIEKSDEGTVAESKGIDFISFPIPDP
jgi:hypothetical protein